MRRSSAPSLNSNTTFKRPKFSTPFLSNNSIKEQKQKEDLEPVERNVKDVLKLLSNKPLTSKENTINNHIKDNSICNRNEIFNNISCNLEEDTNDRFEKSQDPSRTNNFNNFSTPNDDNSFKNNSIHLCNNNNEKNNSDELENSIYKFEKKVVSEENEILYFNVMWCKLSKKKHKKWEGDAILTVKRKMISLTDLEGKQLGQATGYKWNQLKDLQEGQTLIIGAKEIEVLSSIKEEDYKSGKCFQVNFGGTQEIKTSVPPISRALQASGKNFINPSKEVPKKKSENKFVDCSRPQVIPQGCFILPRPSDSHQWHNNTSGFSFTEVYVDLFLSKHLRPHQKQGISFLYKCILGFNQSSGMEGGAILADEMGLGKTLQCISLIWTLYKQGPYGGKPILRKILIVVPGSLVKNWLKEFKKWLSFERMSVFAASTENKVQEFVNQPVMIISYEMLVRHVESLKRVHFDLVVCDEGHRLKNSNIKTAQSINSLNIRRRIILTGTPIQNDLQELFSLVDFCSPGVLGTSSSFKHVFENPILASRQSSNLTKEEALLGETRASELNRITSQLILRRTQEINNQYLPPKVDIVLFCSLSPLQHLLYNKLVGSKFTKTCLYNLSTSNSSSSSSSSSQHLTCISALRKLCNHPELIYEATLPIEPLREEEEESHQNNSNLEDLEPTLYDGLFNCFPDNYGSLDDLEKIKFGGKIDVLMSLLRSFNNKKEGVFEKVVVVSNYTKTLDFIEKLCVRERYSFLRLDGKTQTSKRQEVVERFNNPSIKDFIFLLSTKAGGVGLNLIGASRLVLFDIDWNPATDLQAMARVWRDGQKKRTFVYRLLCSNSIEEKMYQRQVSKQGLSGVVVDSRSSSSSSNSTPLFSKDQLKELFLPAVEVSNCLSSTHLMIGCDCLKTKVSIDKNEDLHSNKKRKVDQNEDEEKNESLYDKLKNYNQKENTKTTPCQLPPRPGQHFSPPKSKNSCMDQLLDWVHTPGPDPNLSLLDPLLTTSKFPFVTFAFSAESNNQSENIIK